MTQYVKTYDHPLRTDNGNGSVPVEELGGSSITRTSAPAAEDMTDPSAVLYLDVAGTRLMVASLLDGEYRTATVVNLIET